MWTRAELKTRAKVGLKAYYWYGFLVCFLDIYILVVSPVHSGKRFRRTSLQRINNFAVLLHPAYF